jgi:hypothetical protein
MGKVFLWVLVAISPLFLSGCGVAKAAANSCHIEMGKVEYYYNGICPKDEVAVGYEVNRDVVRCVKQSVVCQ